MVELGFSFLYCCFTCGNPVSFHNDIISTNFQSHTGRAVLFLDAMNVHFGKNETRQLLTGPHVIADVCCSECSTVLGWKYEKAFADQNKWKEGKICLSLYKICREKIYDDHK